MTGARKKGEVRRLRDALKSLRTCGALMANLCYNLSQEAHPEGVGLSAHARRLMKAMQERWDREVGDALAADK